MQEPVQSKYIVPLLHNLRALERRQIDDHEHGLVHSFDSPTSPVFQSWYLGPEIDQSDRGVIISDLVGSFHNVA
jgi:hypothetical protein